MVAACESCEGEGEELRVESALLLSHSVEVRGRLRIGEVGIPIAAPTGCQGDACRANFFPQRATLRRGRASTLLRVLPSTGEFALLQDSSDNEIVG